MRPHIILTTEEKQQLARSTFSKTDLSGVDFSGADLRQARFDQVCLLGADFSRADLRRAEFLDCDLRGASFTQARWGENVLHQSLFSRAKGVTREEALYIQCCGGTFFSIADLTRSDF